MEKNLESKKAMSLGKKSIIGLIAGLIIGAILCFVPASTFRDDFLIGTVFNIVGNGYLTAVNALVDDDRAQLGAGGVYPRRESGRPRAEYGHVVNSVFQFICPFN